MKSHIVIDVNGRIMIASVCLDPNCKVDYHFYTDVVDDTVAKEIVESLYKEVEESNADKS